ncbi:MAG: C-terminal binding protein [Clostridiales bacterium]
MKICFVDKQWLSKETMEIQRRAFEGRGMEITFHDYTSPQEIIQNNRDAAALMVVAVPITRNVIEAMPNLKFIGRCGIGYDSVDLEAATQRGIAVCNVPDYCAHEVASHSLALALALRRQLFPFAARARAGGYGQGSGYPVERIKGQVFALLGYGRIARELAAMARGIGMQVAVYDPYVKEISDSHTTLYADIGEVLDRADILSVHTPLTPQTRHMLAAPQFKRMKNTAILINTSRGPVIHTGDMMEALKKGEIAGAGLDVCEGEPLGADHPLLQMENVIFTPHVAMYSEAAMKDLHNKLTGQALDVLQGRYTENIVNPEVRNYGVWL